MKRDHNFNKVSYLLIACLLMVGCVKQIDTIPTSTTYNKEVEEYRRALEESKTSASLWTDIKGSGTLFLDYKARKIGDIVIVQIMETSSATNTNTTSATKSTDYDLSVNHVLGLGKPFTPSIRAQGDNSFSGKGSKQKVDRVQATIAARIIEVLPSGNLVIEGAREIVVDQEKQVITIKGVIRQKDINSSNVVASTSIADAQITYSGKGMLSDVNKKGWLAHVVDWVWPF